MSHHSTTKLRFLTAILCLAAMPAAFAQDQQVSSITIKLDPAEVKTLARGLDTIPSDKSAMMLGWKIQTQIDAQSGPEWTDLRSPNSVVDLR